MQEQVMVTDALNSINSGLKSLADMIAQTDNQELRQTLQKFRNEGETCQFELYTIAKSKNYYQPSQKATQDEIMNVKNFVNSQGGQSGMSGQSGMTGQGHGSMR
ncbi:spore coat protein [Anaerocolumna sp. AGMB13025]|uniref:spore coat protein n=1 Tax=Anaerocolumna sp. AGMB13025 TaxID=3039116 RepID=UPI00241F08EF|nr:spore coat protein [Anaerocolumna sp. AGMB13025]WFR59677.1 spore coat protein [Anaerocolumna sp. AGMB13025]